MAHQQVLYSAALSETDVVAAKVVGKALFEAAKWVHQRAALKETAEVVPKVELMVVDLVASMVIE